MRGAVRSSDIVCRMGGEEFLVVAPNTEGRAALQLGERIRCAIERQQPGGLALKKPVTVSIGVAGSRGDKPGWKTLISLADQALYRVKQGSRNGVQLFQN